MVAIRVSESMYGAARFAQLQAELADDAVCFAGRGKNTKIVHLIEGSSKGQTQPTAICGLWVSNTVRQPHATEAICSKCRKGGTSFTSLNQPRACSSCGRMFADSKYRDNTDATCPECYEVAGIENEHADGGHKDAPCEDCPSCQARPDPFEVGQVYANLYTARLALADNETILARQGQGDLAAELVSIGNRLKEIQHSLLPS